jgi:hypothetical protein
MPKGKRKRKSTSRFRKYFRRHKDKRISIIGTAGVVGSLFTPQISNIAHMSLGEWIVRIVKGQEPDIVHKVDYVLADTLAQYTGYHFKDCSWGIPMGTVVLLLSGVASKVAGKFGNKYLKNVPLVGKYVKM